MELQFLKSIIIRDLFEWIIEKYFLSRKEQKKLVMWATLLKQKSNKKTIVTSF